MKKMCIALFFLAALSGQVSAGEVRVSWQEPEKFTDIRPSNERASDFQSRLIKEFDQMFAELAKKLPDGYQWDVTVTDVDLAGDVRPFFHASYNEIRVIKELYWPRMSFNFELKDAQGNSVASGKEDIKDMAFLMRTNIPSGHNSFQYEEQMLRDWFHTQQKEKIFPSR
ncbi:DUF3016 domain-containing protein [Undibacterium sp. TJN19]|uniref:DUF3016 domain-containing protein n=1 Tax=Undibacterium sp. TJN19 TaxID=3413055 RepID=UPI003BF315FC